MHIWTFCTMAGALLLAIAAAVTAMVGHGPAAKTGYSPVTTHSFASVGMGGVRGAPATVGGVEARLVDVTAHDRNVKAASSALTACKKIKATTRRFTPQLVIAEEEERYGTPRTGGPTVRDTFQSSDVDLPCYFLLPLRARLLAVSFRSVVGASMASLMPAVGVGAPRGVPWASAARRAASRAGVA